MKMRYKRGTARGMRSDRGMKMRSKGSKRLGKRLSGAGKRRRQGYGRYRSRGLISMKMLLMRGLVRIGSFRRSMRKHSKSLIK